MAELKAALFRDYFGGSWLGKIIKNGRFQREVVFNWPITFGKFSSLGTKEGLVVPYGGAFDDTKQITIAGWRANSKRWVISWYNEFGGYGEVQWTSQDELNEVKTIYGFGNECKQETSDITDHILKCEIIDQDNFKYTLQSFKKGLVEIVAHRIRTSNELEALMKKQASAVVNIKEIEK